MAHACLERFYEPGETAHFDWHERLRLTTHNHNWVRVRPMKHKQIAELAAVAGVSFWEMDGKVLCHEQMQSMYTWIKKNEERLKYTWNLGDHKWAKRGGEFRATKNPEHIKLQRLLERWAGYTLRRAKRTRKRATERIPPQKVNVTEFRAWLATSGRTERYEALGAHSQKKKRAFLKAIKAEEKASRTKRASQTDYIMRCPAWKHIDSMRHIKPEA